MDIKKLVGNWLKKQINRLGPSGLIGNIQRFIGRTLATRVVNTLIDRGVNAAIIALGTKIGALAGPVGVIIGWGISWL